MPSPSAFYLDQQIAQVSKTGHLLPPFWRYLQDVQNSIGSIDLATQVTGVLPTANGGTNHTNLSFTTTGATNATFQGSGTQTLVSTTSPITAVELTVTTGVTADSGGIKHKRLTTGSIGGGTSALVTVNWSTSFADANYTVVASVLDSTAATASLSVVHVETLSAGAVAVRVANGSGGALTGTLHVIAMHD